MNMRVVGGVILGLLVWYLAFWFVGVGFGAAWPDYRAAARLFFDTQDFSGFTLPMMLTNFALFALCGLAGGWVASRIGRAALAGKVLAGLVFSYAAVTHFYFQWGNLPDWYNLVVPWIIGGSIWLGARITASPRSTPS